MSSTSRIASVVAVAMGIAMSAQSVSQADAVVTTTSYSESRDYPKRILGVSDSPVEDSATLAEDLLADLNLTPQWSMALAVNEVAGGGGGCHGHVNTPGRIYQPGRKEGNRFFGRTRLRRHFL